MEFRKAKTKTRFRWFRCFRPEELHDDIVLPPCPKMKTVDDPPLTYIVVPEKQSVVLPFSAFAAAKSLSGREDNSSPRKKIVKENHNSFRRALVAAMNRTPLAKKMSSKKSKKHKDPFSRESSMNLTNTTTNSSSPSSYGFTPSSSRSTTSTTLSSTSTGTNTSGCSLTEPSLPKSLATIIGSVVAKEKHIGDSEKGCFGNSSMAVSFLLLTSLLVLIMWGKCCAIAFTSIGFFLVPKNRRRMICKEGAVCEESEYKS
ncbi:hypothetical protein VNO78_06373 [Psophocarpus tetragonolobus]|uniref:Uncharacterized protein n=1 Tax=Psophocarpus tetragonolobus TaxID=3891 RepID=A0AAN9XRS1_PSOTE